MTRRTTSGASHPDTSVVPPGSGQFTLPLVFKGRQFDLMDLLVVSLLVALGAVHLTWHRKIDDYFNYPYYIEITRSLLAQRFYGYDYRFETLYPPGFAGMLALISVVFGSGEIVFARSMTVFLFLGMLVPYALLEREAGRPVAAAVCLLLVSSPDMFAFSTQLISSELPFLLTSFLCLIAAARLDNASSLRARVGWCLLFSVFLAVTLIIRTAGIALLAALVAWLGVSLLKDRTTAGRRLQSFLPGLLLGGIALGGWMRWGEEHAQAEWPIPGWPQSYFSQLVLKSGNDPELGRASVADIPARVNRNLIGHGEWLARLLTHKKWRPEWYSPGVAGMVLLGMLGLYRSFRQTGGNLVDWYFIIYELMFLLWPWNIEYRFVLPVVPLAGLYLWRGILQLARLASHGSVPAAMATVLVATVLAYTAGFDHPADLAAWVVLAGGALVFGFVTRVRRASRSTQEAAGSGRAPASGAKLGLRWQAGLFAAVAILFAIGVSDQRLIARENAQIDPSKLELEPDVEAAQWIKSNSAPADVVMARKLEVVYHFCHHKVVWLPPLSSPDVLMAGIGKYRVAWVLITDEPGSYYLPTETECLAALERKFPDRLRLAHEGPRYRIFAVTDGKPDSGIRSDLARPAPATNQSGGS
jgi:hypothetical protein